MRVLFLTKYGILGGSSRHMVFSYLEYCERASIECKVLPLFDDYYFSFRLLSHPATARQVVPHIGYFMFRLLQRVKAVLQANSFDVVVFEKELLPYFPYGLESILERLKPRMVSLYDDAVHIGYQRHPSAVVRLMGRNKIERIMRLSAHVIVWNQYLADYARQFNSNVTIINSGVDLRRYRLKTEHDCEPHGRVIIGWIGTPNSYPYLEQLEGVFRYLALKYDVTLRIVSSIDYLSANIRLDNRRWSIATEVDDLCSFDIGIMPLADDAWTRGKSAYKAVQYLAVGVPAVGSPVGVTVDVIRDGATGFLARTPAEWIERLSILIEQPHLRAQLGLAGRQLVENTFSIQAMAPRYIEALQQSTSIPNKGCR